MAGCDGVVGSVSICDCDVEQRLWCGRWMCGHFLAAAGDVELWLMRVVEIEVEIEVL